jgi:hypothetical protein
MYRKILLKRFLKSMDGNISQLEVRVLMQSKLVRIRHLRLFSL